MPAASSSICIQPLPEEEVAPGREEEEEDPGIQVAMRPVVTAAAGAVATPAVRLAVSTASGDGLHSLLEETDKSSSVMPQPSDTPDLLKEEDIIQVLALLPFLTNLFN